MIFFLKVLQGKKRKSNWKRGVHDSTEGSVEQKIGSCLSSLRRRYLEREHFVEYLCILYIDVKQFLADGS